MSYRLRPYTDNQRKRFSHRDTILACMPAYPDSAKGGDIRGTLLRHRNLAFTDAQWQHWIRLLLQDKRLIRLPGARLAKPRGPSDLTHHVPPFTKKVKQPRLTLAQQLKAANTALNLQMKNKSQK